ncbi:transferrin [Hermetia illucens]|uniref:transferrin n=1 Tax=Hermetia illucens TaxID=343691 RepID=UPI0018CC0DCF|nr:transferrin [Hermetia illucens]
MQYWCRLFVSFMLIATIAGQWNKGKNNEKLRVCIVEGRGLYRKTEKFCPTLESKSNIECVIGVDRLDCIRRIQKGSAHFGVFSAEDLVAARWATTDILVTSEMRFHNTPFEYEVVAVVDNEAGIHSPHDLRGAKFCHPGHGIEPHWTEILANYFESMLLPKLCESDLSLTESRIKASANFFGSSCKAGPWVPDRIQDRILKNRYPSLCELCYDSYRCGVGDKHWGRRGALYCLTTGGGEVAWARLDDVRSHFGFSGLIAEANPNEYSFLCPDGLLQPLNSTYPCVWVAKPWQAIAAKNTHAANIQDIVHNLSHYDADWKHALLSLLETYHVNITSLDTTVPIGDYLEQAVGFQSAYSFPSCNPPRSIVFCTTSLIQHSKCSWLQEAASVYGIEPNLQCIRTESLERCLDDTKHKAADVVLVDQDHRVKAQKEYKLKPILYEFSKTMHERYVTVAIVKDSNLKTMNDLQGLKACFPSHAGAAYLSVMETLRNVSKIKYPDLEEYFSSDSCTWKTDNCPEKFKGDEGALRCLLESGSVAFLSYDIFKNFTEGKLNTSWTFSGNRKMFSTVCPHGKNAKDEVCYLHWTPRGHLMIHADTSLIRRNEIHNSLRDMDRLFGKDMKAHTPSFTMFGPFDKRNNIIFRDNTEGLRGFVELSKDKMPRSMEDVYDMYSADKYVNSEGVRTTTSILGIVLVLTVAIFR